MTISSAQKIYYQPIKVSGITKGRGVHTLRHFFASHLLEAGYDIFTIKGTVVHRTLSITYRHRYQPLPTLQIKNNAGDCPTTKRYLCDMIRSFPLLYGAYKKSRQPKPELAP